MLVVVFNDLRQRSKQHGRLPSLAEPPAMLHQVDMRVFLPKVITHEVFRKFARASGPQSNPFVSTALNGRLPASAVLP